MPILEQMFDQEEEEAEEEAVGFCSEAA